MQNKRLYRNFLILEFGALAVLLLSLFWLGQMSQAGQPLHLGHRILPVIASGLTLTGFLGCMYIRWLRAAEAVTSPRKTLFIFFWVFALTLFAIWLVAASQWMLDSRVVAPIT